MARVSYGGDHENALQRFFAFNGSDVDRRRFGRQGGHHPAYTDSMTLTDNLIVSGYYNGALQYSVPVGGELASGSLSGSSGPLFAPIYVTANIYDPNGTTLSDTFIVQTFSDLKGFNWSFNSDGSPGNSDGVP